MLYIYLDTHQIKLLHLKKSLLGAYELPFTKKYLIPIYSKMAYQKTSMS